VDEKFWREPATWDAVLLELVAFALNLKGTLFEGDSVEESSKLRLSALKDVDLPSKDGGALVDVLCA
jgi:hypothetical protein